jgi:hypothetical protein
MSRFFCKRQINIRKNRSSIRANYQAQQRDKLLMLMPWVAIGESGISNFYCYGCLSKIISKAASQRPLCSIIISSKF